MGLGKFAKDVVKEGKRVRWPKREVLIPHIIGSGKNYYVCAVLNCN